MDLFDLAFTFTIGAEGGFTDDPQDPGNWTGGQINKGRLLGTKYGISAASFPMLNIPDLTLKSAKDIYQKHYWTPIKGQAQPPAFAIASFDAAVNSGVRRASLWLQQALGATSDGIIGPETLGLLQQHNSWLYWQRFLNNRLIFLQNLPGWAVFGQGWQNRLHRLEAYAVPYLPDSPNFETSYPLPPGPPFLK